MSQVIEPPTRTMPPALPARKRWSVHEVEKIDCLGLFGDKKTELIDGEIFVGMSIKPPHAAFLAYLLSALMECFGKEYVLPSFSLRIDDWNEPEPDAAVLARPVQSLMEYKRIIPSDVAVAVEISDETLAADLTTKAVLYARAGIAEYWVVAVEKRILYVHRQPGTDGYSEVTEYTEADTVELADAKGTLAVADLIP